MKVKQDVLLVEYNGRTPFDKQLFKIHHDGSHYVGNMVFERKQVIKKNQDSQEKRIVSCLSELYMTAVQSGIKEEKIYSYIKNSLPDALSELSNINELLEKGIKQAKHNIYSRLKRFRRKARLNKWTHSVTITYDDKKHSEESFRTKLKKTLSNLHTRRGWKYMGAFERSPKNKRLHFHALFYIPKNEMVGEMKTRRDFSTKEHKMQTTIYNTFFEKAFGRNDFEKISDAQEVKKGKAIDYITKYITKSGEKILYSRDIPSEIYKYLSQNDLAANYFDFVSKYVLFDDVIDIEKDIQKIECIEEQCCMYDYAFL